MIDWSVLTQWTGMCTCCTCTVSWEKVSEMIVGSWQLQVSRAASGNRAGSAWRFLRPIVPSGSCMITPSTSLVSRCFDALIFISKHHEVFKQFQNQESDHTNANLNCILLLTKHLFSYYPIVWCEIFLQCSLLCRKAFLKWMIVQSIPFQLFPHCFWDTKNYFFL